MQQNTNREIKYVNKDFAELRSALITHLKTYFPNTYSDFNESDPGMAFLELAAYVGDVSSFYTDVQLQESFLYTVTERINLYNLAQSHGYKVKTVSPSSVDLEIFQLVPSIGAGTDTRPDYNYALQIRENMIVSTDDNINFRTLDMVNFKSSGSYDPTTVSVYSVTEDGQIEYYLLKKTVKAVSGEIRTLTYSFDDPKVYDKIVLPDTNISEIIDVVDSDGHNWYEVPFMAQDLIPVAVRNTPYNDPVLHQFSATVPYLLTFRQTDKRFVTRMRKDERLEIQFGAGVSSESDEEILPNPLNVGIGLDYYNRAVDQSIDPMNFLYTKTYGTAPSNTTLTVRYSVSNGLSDNVNSNSLTTILESDIIESENTADPTILQTIQNSLAVNNPLASMGGLDKNPFDVIREEAMANFAAQNRAVIKEDYILRCYTMPAKFGSISKAYVEQDSQISRMDSFERIPNPFALNVYILSYDANKNFVAANEAIKENLRVYLRQYRMMTDGINIKDPSIVNIGINFEIITRPDQNSNEVLARCIKRFTELFDNTKMEINAPIMLSKLYTEIDKIQGVQTVQKIEIINLYDINKGYSGNYYDIESATRSGIIYPSLDPCVFELKFPKTDIKGKVNDI
jgi:hypothetical protein